MVQWVIADRVDLSKDAQRQQVGAPEALMLPGDNEAHRWEITVLNNGEAADLTGASVAGYFLRSDGETVAVVGSVTGNVISVVLAQECYAFEGLMRAIVRVTLNGVITTVIQRLFRVQQDIGDQIIDPGEVIPDIDELLAQIAAMEAATAAANAAAAAVPSIITQTFSTSKAYAAGEYVYYNGALYRFTTDHAKGEWDATQVESLTVGLEMQSVDRQLNAINSAVNTTNADYTTEPGYINESGGISPGTHGEVTTEYIFSPAALSITFVNPANVQSLYSIGSWASDGTFNRQVVQVTKNTTKTALYTFTGDIEKIRITYRTSNSETMDFAVTHQVYDELISLRAVSAAHTNSIHDFYKQPFFNLTGQTPCYDHLFVNNYGERATIPAESIYHIGLSNVLGFHVIELHPQATSDGQYFVNHLESGKFGRYFHHVDGETDISAVVASSVTWQWIVDNVRYNSSFPKYQTRPTTLEEALIACKANNLIPLMKIPNDTVRGIVNQYLGENQYIVYDGTRAADGDSAFICSWENHSTKAEIVSFCETIGAPLLYGFSYPSTFSDADLKDIVQTLHGMGIYTAVSYEGDNWPRYHRLGVDVCGAVFNANRLPVGNAFNLRMLTSTDDFTITGGTVADNVITLSDGGMVVPANINSNTVQLARVDLEVRFDGTLVVTDGLGEFRGNREYSSADGNLIMCTPIINKKINFKLTSVGASTIYDISYKVSLL